MYSKIVNMFFSLFFIVFLQSGFGQSEGIPQKIEDQLELINQEMTEAIIDGEYEIILKHYADDVIVMPDFTPPLKGIKALEKQYEKDFRKGLKYHSFGGNVEVRWKIGNEIYERGSFGMSLSVKDSPKPLAYHGSYFQIWEITDDDECKIKFTIWNLDFNPCQ